MFPSNLAHHNLTLFHLKLLSKHVPSSTIQIISNEITKLLEHNNQCISDVLTEKLINMEIDISTVQEISKVFTNNAFLSTQNDLRTEYFRKKAFSEMFDFVVPVYYELGFNKEKKKCPYQYVPIL